MTSATRAIEVRTGALAAASVQPLYADPFWEARYGAQRARRFGDEDAVFHVRYLVQALDAQRPAVMEDYARWLRTLLVTRGMCSLHLDQHLEGLIHALAQEGFGPDSQPHAYVQAGRRALLRTTGPAHRLEEATPGVVQAVSRGLAATVPPAVLPGLEQEVRLHLSYLSDALALERADLWEAHLRWYAGFWPQRKLDPLTLPHLLRAVEQALGQAHPEARSLLARTADSWEEQRS